MTSHTPSDIISSRADALQPNMGLQNWIGAEIRKQDATVSKNYLTEAEIKELNRLTSILLDIFEDQLDLGRLVTMEDAVGLLDRQLSQLGRAVLKGGGSVRADAAKARADLQYEEYAKRRRAERQAEGERAVVELAAVLKPLPKRPRN